MNDKSRQLSAVEAFRCLHTDGCFVLPNPWDPGTAVYLAQLGFKALATTSAGYAFSRGLPDDVLVISCDEVLNHVREVVDATSLPVNADFQNGYADEPEDVAQSVSLCIATGAAGLSIEDATGKRDAPLYDKWLAVERIRAARHAIDESGVPVILTARCEAWLVGHTSAFEISIERLVAFADAGADCLYAPGVSDPGQIEAIVKAVSPKPVNVLVSRPDPNLTVSRLARVAWGAFIRAASGIISTGTFDELESGAPFTDLNEVFGRRT